MTNEYSVYQFFMDGSYECIKQFISAEEAVKTARFYTNNVSARIGLTVKVIITDGGDLTCFVWKYKEGVVFPPREEQK